MVSSKQALEILKGPALPGQKAPEFFARSQGVEAHVPNSDLDPRVGEQDLHDAQVYRPLFQEHPITGCQVTPAMEIPMERFRWPGSSPTGILNEEPYRHPTRAGSREMRRRRLLPRSRTYAN
jgi:hypothetical protein